jgi:hypothetical protein
MDAYDAFADAKTSGAFKVVLEGAKHQQLVPATQQEAVGSGERGR